MVLAAHSGGGDAEAGETDGGVLSCIGVLDYQIGPIRCALGSKAKGCGLGAPYRQQWNYVNICLA